jgi:hypothetical protein
MVTPKRYRSVIANSDRWDGFELRPDDIVISTPPKCGTTLTQMLCALLIFDGPDLPDRLDTLSPWLDMNMRSVDEVHAMLAAQTHRRFIKTHTPLDGLPWDDHVTYLVVGRDPRDVAVSWQHHRDNADISRVIETRQRAVGLDDLPEVMTGRPWPDDPTERFRQFVDEDDLRETCLASVLHHLDTGWQRRDLPNVALFHYGDYRADLAGEITRLAEVLGIDVTPEQVATDAEAAGLDAMRARADELVPDGGAGVFVDPAGFFRSGGSGEWQRLTTDADRVHYAERVAQLAAPDLAEWAHVGWRGISEGRTPGRSS